MTQLFSNAARAELISPINTSDTTLYISEEISLFPIATVGTRDLEEGDWFKVILQDREGIEIVYVRTRVEGGETLSNVLRGQEGTVARAFLPGTVVGLRQTAENAAVWEAKADAQDLQNLADSITDDIAPELAAINDRIDTGILPTFDTKVDKVPGKGLSANDLTDLLKEKLDSIESRAEVNPVIVNDLVSTSTTRPLSAMQGKVLKDLVDSINALLQSDDSTLDELQEIVDFIKLNRADLDSLGITSIAGLETALAGKQPLDTVLTGTTASFTTALLSKLNAIATGATKNATDVKLRDRGTHTGEQAISTVTGLQGALDSKVDSTTFNARSITAGNGLSGGGNFSANRTVTLGTPSTITNSTTNAVTATSHTHAITITKADVGLSNVTNVAQAAASTQVIAGTGLTGGGTLAANRTLNVSYGTASGTAAQGNDSRLSNSREWTASTVSQAEAEAGSATTRRAWTAQRVRQAVASWWSGVKDTKQDTLTAGSNITISGSTINATDTKYSTMSAAEMEAGTSTTGRLVSAKGLAEAFSGGLGYGQAWQMVSGRALNTVYTNTTDKPILVSVMLTTSSVYEMRETSDYGFLRIGEVRVAHASSARGTGASLQIALLGLVPAGEVYSVRDENLGGVTVLDAWVELR